MKNTGIRKGSAILKENANKKELEMSNLFDRIKKNGKNFVEYYTNEFIEDIEINIKEHMKNQPYFIRCSECGKEVTICKKQVDSSLNLIFDIEPCNCQRKIKN